MFSKQTGRVYPACFFLVKLPCLFREIATLRSQ